jgi:hypothetical protein
MRHFSIPGGLLATILFTAVCAQPVRADAPSILENAVLTTLKQPSYHMTMVTPARTIEADVVNPGRMHMVTTNMEMIVIDRTMYMKQNGTWRRFPGVDIMKAQQNPLQALAAAKGQYTVDDLGPRAIGGAALHAYRVTNLKTKSIVSVFVDGSGRIVRYEIGPEVIQMSKFGEPIRIVAPM